MNDIENVLEKLKPQIRLWWTDFLRDLASIQEALVTYRLKIIFGAVYVFLSIFTMLHFLHGSNLGDVFYRTQFEAMYSGTAWKPFVYRVLIPKTTRAIVEATPQGWQQGINDSLYSIKFNPAFDGIRSLFPWLKDVYPDPNRIYPRAVMTLLIYGCLWGYIWAMYQFAGAMFPGNTAVQLFTPIFGMLIIPSFSWQFEYVYDIPVLFLSTTCYYLMATNRFKPYIIFFTLAVLNKESSVYILLLFGLWFFNRLDHKRFVILWTAQCLIYALIKATVTMIYLRNPGWYLEHNVTWVMTSDLFSRSGYTRILMIALTFFLLTFRWQEKPLFLKYIFWVAPFFYAAYVMFGVPGEYRVFFDMLPPMILLGVHTLIDSTGIAHSPVFANVNKKDSV